MAAWILAVPLILGSAGVMVGPAARWLFAGAPGEGRSKSLGEAILRESVGDVYLLLEAGEDPDALFDVREERLTGDRAMRVTPLVLAVAVGDENLVRMLLDAGARPDAPGNAWAVCVAEASGRGNLVQMLEARVAVVVEVPCPDAEPGGPPLAVVGE
jgi:hypothetical protein